MELNITWDEPKLNGLSNLVLGSRNGCPVGIGCSGSVSSLPALPPFDFDAYLCHPPSAQRICDSVPNTKLLSQSWLAPAEVQAWVVEVAYPAQLIITFSWDTSDLPSGASVWIVDKEGRIDMANPGSRPDFPRIYSLSFSPGDNKKAFLICSQIISVQVSSSCPKKR